MDIRKSSRCEEGRVGEGSRVRSSDGRKIENLKDTTLQDRSPKQSQDLQFMHQQQIFKNELGRGSDVVNKKN